MASDDAIRQAAEQLLRRNLRRGVSPFDGQAYCYSAPSPATYRHQFFWDSCFHAIVWAHFDPEQAKEELRSLLRAQDADGHIPHRIAWDRRGVLPRAVSRRWRAALHPMRSQLVGPPVLAIAIERVYERCGDGSFLAEALPAADRFYSWLAPCRDSDGDGLVSIIHPYESGLDHKPSYDAVFGLRRAPATATVLAAKAVDGWNRLLNFNRSLIFRLDRFNVVDVGFNCIYGQALASLARLWAELGDHAKAEAWQERARRVEQAILSKCVHDDGLYYDLYSRRQKKALVKTVTCLFPLLLDSIEPAPAERLVREHLLDGDAFWLPYPIPTVSASEAAFSPGFVSSFASGLWRGPTCIAANWLLVQGLRKHGFGDVANTIVERTRRLVERGGFRECYNPLTGQPYGAESFGWSTLVVDMLATRPAGPG